MCMTKFIGLTAILLILCACSTKVKDNYTSDITSPTKNVQNVEESNNIDAEIIPKTIVQTEQKDVKITEIDIKNSLGLITLDDNEKFYKDGDSINIYNQDGSLWYKFIYFDDKRSITNKENKNFHPFRYDLDDYFLYFNFVGQDNRYYHVVVNEENGLKKYLKKDDPIFKIETWEQYILNCFAIDFNPNNNPLREEPNGKSIFGYIPMSLTFHPESIKEDWLKVRWYKGEHNQQEPKFGWVRWKKDNKIVINLFETA